MTAFIALCIVLTLFSPHLSDLKRPDDVDTSSPLRLASDTPPTYNDVVSDRRNVITENVDSLSKGLNSAADVIRAKTDSKSSSKGAGQSAKEYPSVRETKNALESTYAPGRPGASALPTTAPSGHPPPMCHAPRRAEKNTEQRLHPNR